MAGTETIKCFIHFMDGNSMNFEFQDDTGDNIHVGTEIHKVVDSHNFCLELDGKLVFIPMSNIRTIELSPAPAKMPPGYISGAKTIS